ncbi:putative hydroxyacyl-CoA dehydrogenase [Aureobasidium pullulans]|uniref:Putative hydroxyacyl-CoA dehydrogenase n=1 Tax=Aureobasidium pullulans TaxID=5580 RepID=A0A4S9BSB8_AURPU|nr:putative hydroxyacyl-CoA dehydrogenase [Aureobasidium pullulans]
MSAIRTVGVVGTGVIGASWTGLFLANGLRVVVSDPASGSEKKLKKYLQNIWPDLKKIGLKSGASLDNYQFVGTSLKDHYFKVDFIQENAPEKIEIKTSLLAEIDAATRPDIVIASSSSGLPSSKFIGKCTNNPGRILIGHPFNPPHLMPLVEIVPNPKTEKSSVETAVQFYKSLNKRPVVLHQEVPGFAANRLQAALCSEAYSLVSRGIISAEDLDACVTNSLGPRWALTGPLLANAMGGGGGTDGFRHLLEHLGPATEVWLKDMQENAFEFNKESLDALSTSVGEELKGKDVQFLEAERDRLLVEILKLKSEYK